MNDFERLLYNIQSELTETEKSELKKTLEAGWENIKRSFKNNDITVNEVEIEKLYKLSVKAQAFQDDDLEKWCREGIKAWMLEGEQIKRLKAINTFEKQACIVGKVLINIVLAVLTRTYGGL
jgi:hypothetical protein